MTLKIFTATEPARLLLVDDHPMLRRGLANLLSLEKDVQVVAEASHGLEALEVLNDQDIDLVILDHNMPVLNGIETLKKIRELGINTKVLLFTVSDNSKDVQDALQLSADGICLKIWSLSKSSQTYARFCVVSWLSAPVWHQFWHKLCVNQYKIIAVMN